MSGRDVKDSHAARCAPYAQLVKMLLPSAGSVALYGPEAQLWWCSDGYERPDLRALLDLQRASDTLASRGRVDRTAAGVPVFISALRAVDARPLGSIVIELAESSTRNSESLIVSMLRPVLNCLEGHLTAEHSTLAEDRSAGLDLLLAADEHQAPEANALEALLEHTVTELGCATGALLVPNKHIEIVCAKTAAASAQLLDRTQKHLLAWAQLNNRPMLVNRGAGGSDAPYKILSCPVRDPEGRVIGLTALFRAANAPDFEPRDARVLEFVCRKAHTTFATEHDALTGLPNFRVFGRRVQQVLDQSREAALLYVDVDKLAAVNAAFGYAAGDEVIQHVGELVRRAAGVPAHVSRVAGDRFAAVLPDRNMAEARKVAEAIVTAAGQLGYVVGTDAVPVSVSVGVVTARAGQALPHWLAAGELACQYAKDAGSGCSALLDETDGSAEPRQLVAAEHVRSALASRGFELLAQPIVSLKGVRPVGFEFLLRLRHASGELLAPDKFLAACETYRLLPALDRWAFAAAVDMLRSSAGELRAGKHFFTVNVSAPSLKTGEYAAFALATLANADIAPSLMCFEIKESAAVGDLQAADAFIREMTGVGARVALDDFGAGLSSLAHLKHLPVSYLKIDGRFVRRMLADRTAESMVAALASAARTLAIPTIAEHVESGPIADRLRELGVMLGQGFHFGRPVPLGAAFGQAAATAPRSVAQLTPRG